MKHRVAKAANMEHWSLETNVEGGRGEDEVGKALVAANH